MDTDESSTWKFLPDDVIFEILARSGVQSLIKWSKKSKFCYSLLSNEFFMDTQLQVSKSRPLLMFKTGNAIQTGDGDQDPILFRFLNESGAFRIVGSSNGLVCMAFQRRGSSLLVCNPATRELRWLPDCNFWCSFGFGHDPENNDYKLVRFRDDEGKEVQIFSLKSGFWRTSNWPYGEVVDDPGVYVERSLHWKVRSGENNWDVVAQDLSSETCQTIALPPCLKEIEVGSVRLGQSGGRLCFCYLHGHFIDVWVMGEYGLKESWNHRARLSDFFSMNDLRSSKLRDDLIIFVAEEGCSVAKGTSERADREEILMLDDCKHVEATPYIESLISPYQF